jgi:hypothetical protein
MQERGENGAGCKKDAKVAPNARKGRKWCRVQEGSRSGAGCKKGTEVVPGARQRVGGVQGARKIIRLVQGARQSGVGGVSEIVV